MSCWHWNCKPLNEIWSAHWLGSGHPFRALVTEVKTIRARDTRYQILNAQFQAIEFFFRPIVSRKRSVIARHQLLTVFLSFQFHGSSSSRRLAGWPSAMRWRTSAR